MGIREFGFTFEFVPDSTEEAEIVDDIILFFRKNLYPEYSNYDQEGEPGFKADGSISPADRIAYKFPTLFKIQASYVAEERGPDGETTRRLKSTIDNGTKKTPFSHRYKNCHLKSCQVTYDSTEAMTLRPDGRFPARRLVLQFQEEETLAKNDVIAGY